MRVYGLGYREVMTLPISVFWTLSRYAGPVMAMEEIRSLDASAAATRGGEAYENYRRSLRLEIEGGDETRRDDEFDPAGMATLKMMAGQRIGDRYR